MKSIKYLIVLFCILSTSGALFAYKFDFITVGDVVRQIRSTYGNLNSYQANFVIESERHGKRTVQRGVLRFKKSDKMVMEFSQPANQKIVSDGKMMWIYIPSMNVVAEQEINPDGGVFATGTGTGLSRLFSKYHYRFASKEQPEIMRDGSKMYTLELKQRESRSGYRQLNLWVNEDYFITRAEGVTSTGKNVKITLSDIKTNVDFPASIFKFEIPGRARVLNNPMMSEE